jgi:nitrogen fixation-related uncharacterized protein
MNKQDPIMIGAIALVIAVVGGLTYSWYVQTSQYGDERQAHIAECKSHLISYAEAIQRYKQDSGNTLDGTASTLNGLATQDYQNVRTGVQYMNDNCLDAIPALRKDPTLVEQMATLTAPTTHSSKIQ